MTCKTFTCIRQDLNNICSSHEKSINNEELTEGKVKTVVRKCGWSVHFYLFVDLAVVHLQ